MASCCIISGSHICMVCQFVLEACLLQSNVWSFISLHLLLITFTSYAKSPSYCSLFALPLPSIPLSWSPSPEPVDRLPMLLIANLHDIRCTSLSGSTSRLPTITTKQAMAMDFIYSEETVCWIDVGETPADTHLKCASIPDLKTVTNIRTINISLSLHREWLIHWQKWEKSHLTITAINKPLLL